VYLVGDIYIYIYILEYSVKSSVHCHDCHIPRPSLSPW